MHISVAICLCRSVHMSSSAVAGLLSQHLGCLVWLLILYLFITTPAHSFWHVGYHQSAPSPHSGQQMGFLTAPFIASSLAACVFTLQDGHCLLPFQCIR